MTDDIDALATTTDATVGELPNMSNAPDDALLVAEYLGKARNSTLGQLKAALGAITGFEKTAGDCTPGTTDTYTITFANGGKLDILIPIPLNGTDGYTPKKGVDYYDGTDGYTPKKGVDYDDGKDGFSPIVDFKEVTDGVEITITDKTGPHTAKLKNGADGVSPSFRTEVIEGGYRVILSAANEYQQFDLLNGEGGDWSVNNPAWKNYIKGRTHWKEEYGADGEIIPEVSAAFSGTVNFTTVAGAISEGITAKGKYVVTWNGTEYSCEGKEYWDGPYVGNGSIMDSSQEDTGEPFAILMFGDNLYQVWKADKTAETVTVKVVGEKVVIWHKLDKGYLTDGLPYRESVVAEILPETEISGLGTEGIGFCFTEIDLVDGKTYTVKWNGTEYSCVAREIVMPIDEEGTMESMGVGVGNTALVLGEESTGEPFAIIDASPFFAAQLEGIPTFIQAFDGSIDVTISITGEIEVVHKMEGELLPEGTPYAEPFDDVIIASWPVNSFDAEAYIMVTDPVGKVVPGNVYKVNWGGTVYECVARYNADYDTYLLGNGKNVITDLNDGVATDHPFTIAILGPSNATAAHGVTYLIKASSTPENYEFSVVGSLKVRKINEHCLPDSLVPLIVNVSGNSSDGYSADVSFAVANYAALKGRTVLLKHSNLFYQLNSVSDSHIRFSAFNFTTDSSGTSVYYASFYWIATSLTRVSKLLQSYPETT